MPVFSHKIRLTCFSALHKHMMSPQPSQEYEFLLPFKQVLYKETTEAFNSFGGSTRQIAYQALLTQQSSAPLKAVTQEAEHWSACPVSLLPADLPSYRLSNGRPFQKFFYERTRAQRRERNLWGSITQSFSCRSRPETQAPGFPKPKFFLSYSCCKYFLEHLPGALKVQGQKSSKKVGRVVRDYWVRNCGQEP